MKLIISGGRDYELRVKHILALNRLHGEHRITEVISGGATGVDADGENWAQDENIPVKFFHPDWKTHGRAAGPIRNAEMAAYADAVALFPGGRGTSSMRREAQKAGIRIFDFTNL